MKSKTAAQQRADAIRAFRDELTRVEAEGGLVLTEEQRRQIDAHHARLLESLDRSFDIDRTAGEAKLSTGMRVASFLGAVALSASVFYLFQQFWGRLATPLQVAILIAAVVTTFLGTLAIRRHDPSGYFTNLAAMVTFVCFVLDLGLFGKIFNIVPGPTAFLAWSAFAFVLAYAFDLRMLLAAGIVCGGIFLTAQIVALFGVYWTRFIERPENLFVPAALAFAIPSFVSHDARPQFPPVYRGIGLATAMVAILALANMGQLSYLRVDKEWLQSIYQWIGFIGSALMIWLSVRRGWEESLGLGVIFFAIFLFMKFVDWWWETMPRYLFFLVVGLTAILILMILRRIRALAADRLSGHPV